MTESKHPPCFIVPPAVFEYVIREGSSEDREAALNTLAIDASLRASRIHHSLAMATPSVSSSPLTQALAGTPQRTIYDAQSTTDQNATLVVRSEGAAPVADTAVNEAYDGLGDTYAMYWSAYHRNSIDDLGLPMLGEVHFGNKYNNALWDGHRMMFGDGDGRLMVGLTKAIDVVGHELTHGVTENTLRLAYIGQSGALNESISDVFGSLVKQYTLGQPADQADWLIGAGILGPAMPGVALRSMKAPGTAWKGDNQPSTMAHYVHTATDNGGVHTNSGIPNHAFYLAATAIGGNAWEKAGRIWYQTMVTRAVPPGAHFHAFAQATIHTATTLFGGGAAETKAVSDAWKAVGV